MSEKNWYEKWFSNKYYLSLYSHRDEKEARDIINLIQRNIPLHRDSKILDVCCGAGRHSIEFARRGYNVTGFDLSSYLISQATENLKNAKEKDLKVEFLIKDMKNFSFDKSFDAAINIFTSFGYFETDEENFQVFGNIGKSLKKDGYFVFDFINSDNLRETLVPVSEDIFEGTKVIQKRYIKNGFVFKDILIDDEKYNERLRLYSKDEIIHALNDTGFDVRRIFGDYYGNNYDIENSSRMIFVSKCIE
jgi:SAM-dependent methyltransferase